MATRCWEGGYSTLLIGTYAPRSNVISSVPCSGTKEEPEEQERRQSGQDCIVAPRVPGKPFQICRRPLASLTQQKGRASSVRPPRSSGTRTIRWDAWSQGGPPCRPTETSGPFQDARAQGPPGQAVASPAPESKPLNPNLQNPNPAKPVFGV